MSMCESTSYLGILKQLEVLHLLCLIAHLEGVVYVDPFLDCKSSIFVALRIFYAWFIATMGGIHGERIGMQNIP